MFLLILYKFSDEVIIVITLHHNDSIVSIV